MEKKPSKGCRANDDGYNDDGTFQRKKTGYIYLNLFTNSININTEGYCIKIVYILSINLYML